MKTVDTWKRSLAKTMSWRCFSLMITFLVSLIITHSTVFAISISVTDTVVKLFTYFYHERIWTEIKWGKGPPKSKENH